MPPLWSGPNAPNSRSDLLDNVTLGLSQAKPPAATRAKGSDLLDNVSRGLSAIRVEICFGHRLLNAGEELVQPI
ncbi:MAG: hypothetical protein KJ077_01180 [Anaerolineae bacterium]|nr:hypothetical protein [Anaerolineae bacterium]